MPMLGCSLQALIASEGLQPIGPGPGPELGCGLGAPRTVKPKRLIVKRVMGSEMDDFMLM